MTYHFVNLVSISWFFNQDLKLSNLYCDGFLLALTGRIKGVQLKQISGPSMADSIKNLPNLIILGNSGSDQHRFELPHWNNLNEVCLTDEISNRIGAYDNVIIAISSPKQDKLALEINSKFPNKHIFCLGAAVEMKHKIKELEKFNLMWFGFLINQPKRTLIKLYISFYRFLGFIIFKNSHDELNRVLKKFKDDFTCIKRT